MYPMIYQSESLSKKKKKKTAKIFRSLFETFSNQQLDSSTRKMIRAERKRIHPSALSRKCLSWQTWVQKFLLPHDSSRSRFERFAKKAEPIYPYTFHPLRIFTRISFSTIREKDRSYLWTEERGGLQRDETRVKEDVETSSASLFSSS